MTSQLVSITTGNKKIGKVANISLIPGKDCANCSHCVKDCYAVKSYRMYPSVKKAWGGNSELAHTNPELFFSSVREYLDKKKPELFRWHVAGDILDQEYLESMKDIASAYPGTRFIAWTKRHDLAYANLPSNLTILASQWPGMPEDNTGLPKAWYQDGTETRVPENAVTCQHLATGITCEECQHCWHMKPGDNVIIPAH